MSNIEGIVWGSRVAIRFLPCRTTRHVKTSVKLSHDTNLSRQEKLETSHNTSHWRHLPTPSSPTDLRPSLQCQCPPPKACQNKRNWRQPHGLEHSVKTGDNSGLQARPHKGPLDHEEPVDHDRARSSSRYGFSRCLLDYDRY